MQPSTVLLADCRNQHANYQKAKDWLKQHSELLELEFSGGMKYHKINAEGAHLCSRYSPIPQGIAKSRKSVHTKYNDAQPYLVLKHLIDLCQP